jgi:hypothetical protein
VQKPVPKSLDGTLHPFDLSSVHANADNIHNVYSVGIRD